MACFEINGSDFNPSSAVYSSPMALLPNVVKGSCDLSCSVKHITDRVLSDNEILLA